MPLWGRDQNTHVILHHTSGALPDCPCGGEIKTSCCSLCDLATPYQIAPVGARSKQRRGRSWRLRWTYQIAPVGARSKPSGSRHPSRRMLTRLPLWGRDQNRALQTEDAGLFLPDCPCGGEIKTDSLEIAWQCPTYQIAPVGARSKPLLKSAQSVLSLTRLPLWGRDQNQILESITECLFLPDCPCGGEIKTSCALLRPAACDLPDCPCGGEIKTDPVELRRGFSPYQIAPVGARSKRKAEQRRKGATLTRLPLWGRDQNVMRSPPSQRMRLPECPCGGEIKTECQPVRVTGVAYQIAPVGARSICAKKPISF